MTINQSIYSSKTDDWATPQQVFDKLNSEFGFTLDACATSDNAKCRIFFTKEQDGLAQSFGKNVVWVNPPYGKFIPQWVKHSYEQSRLGATVVMLIPCRTDTKWFHEYVTKAEVRFFNKRLSFGDSKNKAPFPVCLAIFRPAGATTGILKTFEV